MSFSFSCAVPTVMRIAPASPSELPARTSTPRSRRPRPPSPRPGRDPRDPRWPTAPTRNWRRTRPPTDQGHASSSMSARRSATVRVTRHSTSSWWRSASTAAAWAAALSVEGLADLIDGDAEILRAAQAVADAQAGQPVDLGEGAQEHEVGEAAEQVDGGERVPDGERVLAVGLVEDDADVARDALRKAWMSREIERGRRRVVGIADEDQTGGHGDLGGHGVEVMARLGVERALRRPAPPRRRPGVGTR